jgi:DNA-binding GntR family transcriptional regulator
MRNSPDRSQPEAIYRRLLDQIVRGRLPPGARIVERSIAEGFGASRTPTREALQRLTHEGFLVAQGPDARRAELRVSPLQWSDIAELWQLLGSLEAIAASRVELLAAQERKRLSQRLLALNAELKQNWGRTRRDPDVVFDLQTQFHRVLVAGCGGPRLQAVYLTVRPHIERYEWLYGASDAAHVDASLAEHDAIACAVAEGNGAIAAQEVGSHWQAAAERSIQVLRIGKPRSLSPFGPDAGSIRPSSGGG